MRYLILLVNDDGIGSKGLFYAWKHLKELGEIVVVAPDRHVSGASKSIGVGRELKVEEREIAGMKAYSVSGTPADCVLLGLFKLCERRPDLVVSGINIGPNLGMDDFLSSGTVGAALEASIHGIKSVCASYCIFGFEAPSIELERSGMVLGKLIETIMEIGFPAGIDILSLNIPANFKGKLKVTKLAKSPYPDVFEEIRPNVYAWKGWAMDLYVLEEGSDVEAVSMGLISLTPVCLKSLGQISPSRELLKMEKELNKRLDSLNF